MVFDSSVPISQGQGVYMSAVAEQLAGDEAGRAIEVYSRRALAHGGVAWTRRRRARAAHLRLYRARAGEHFVLDEHDQRVPVDLG